MVAVEGPATIPGYGDSFPIAQAELAALVHCSGFLSCWCIVGKQELGDAERQDHSWRDIPFAHGGGSLCDGRSQQLSGGRLAVSGGQLPQSAQASPHFPEHCSPPTYRHGATRGSPVRSTYRHVVSFAPDRARSR